MPTSYPPAKIFFSLPTVLGVQDWRVPSFFPNALQTREDRFPLPTALFFNFSYPHRPRRTPLQLDTYVFNKLGITNMTFKWFVTIMLICYMSLQIIIASTTVITFSASQCLFSFFPLMDCCIEKT